MSDAFQDKIPGIHCFGCGPDNPEGLRIKSFWCSENASVCRFTPRKTHIGPPGVVNGGILATVIDCHSVCTAMADAYRRAGRAVGEGDFLPYVTGTMTIKYLTPTPIEAALEARAVIDDVTPRKTTLTCTVTADGVVTAEAVVIAISIPVERIR